MRALLQRVVRGSVEVDGEIIGRIGPGLVILLGVGRGDDEDDADYLARRVANLRIFSDEQGRMNRSVIEAGGEVLAVSQFTLYADTSRGRRPGFSEAAPPEEAEALYERFVAQLRGHGLTVETGRFQASMKVEIINDGPVTMMLESPSAL